MKKIIFLIILTFLTSCTLDLKDSLKIEKNEKQNIKKINTEKQVLKKENNNINSIKENKNNYNTKGLIINGTIHLKNDEYILALNNFLKAYKNKKGNDSIEKKIADTYFLMKKWTKAAKYYSKINDEKIIYKNKYLKSLFLSLNMKKIKENNLYYSGALTNIKSIKQLNNEEIFFYTNTLGCIRDFSLCKLNFQNYIKEHNSNIKLKQLNDIKNSINNYKDFKIDELYFKDTLIIGALFKNEFYSIVINLGENILKEKPNYKPLLKMIAQSYFELGDYQNAKKYLTKYYALDSNDKDVTYILALLSQKTHDFILSSIYFNKAEKLGYQPLENIYRLQIYNYYILDNATKIIEFFTKLIESQKKPLYNDLVLATYYNLINGNINKGEKYAKLGIELYPKKEDFYGFEGWILIEKNKLEQAQAILEKGKNINNNNALINLNLGRIEEKKGNKITAKLYFKRAIKLDNGGEISKMSAKKLEQLEKNNTSSGTQIYK